MLPCQGPDVHYIGCTAHGIRRSGRPLLPHDPPMKYPRPLIEAVWIKRYKRFLVDVRLQDGTQATAHCANTGSMLGINEPGSRCLVLPVDNPRRKLKYTLEAVEADGEWVGAHPIRANTIAIEAIRAGLVDGIARVSQSRAEVPYGTKGRSRADWVVQTPDGPDWVVEVKSASMKRGRVSLFPDAKTARGLKHLEDLMDVVQAGGRAMMLFVATRNDVDVFQPAGDIDPAYSKRLAEVAEKGVLVRAITSRVTPNAMTPVRAIPVDLTTA